VCVCVCVCVCAQNTESTEPKEVRDTQSVSCHKSQVTRICCCISLLVSNRMPNQVGGKPTLLGCHTHEELDRVFRALAELISADETSSEESSESSSIPDLVHSDDEDDDALSSAKKLVLSTMAELQERTPSAAAAFAEIRSPPVRA
jgi:hypothetical protein